MGADLVGGDHERLVLDRPGAQERLPVVARGGQREGGGHGDHACAAHGQDAVQLGKAQVVADGQPQLHAIGGLRGDDLLARLLERRLAVRAPAQLHVEHVQLAVRGPQLALRVHVHARVGELFPPGQALEDRSRHEVHPQLAGDRARPRDRGTVEGLGGVAQLVVRAHRRPLLGEYDQARPVGGRRAGEAIGVGQIC